MYDHRNLVDALPLNQRRGAWQDFLNNEYLPAMRDYFQNNIVRVHELWNQIHYGKTGFVKVGLPEERVGGAAAPRATTPPTAGGPPAGAATATEPTGPVTARTDHLPHQDENQSLKTSSRLWIAGLTMKHAAR